MAGLEFKVKSMVKTYRETIPVLLRSWWHRKNSGVPSRNDTKIPDICKAQFEIETDLRTSDITNGLAQQN
jgi:hypothetical protein